MSIQPFTIAIPQSDLDDLQTRLAMTRFTDEIPGSGFDYGISVAWVKRLVDYWRTDYDWRAWEAKLNAYPQFITTIDGQTIHFIHVRSAREDALALILTHGWPGTVVEYLDVIEELAQGFHLVIPSLPGFGFSGPTSERGWNRYRIARAWAELMRRLGYTCYGAHGGDIGAGVAGGLSPIDPDRVVGVHVISDPPTAVLFTMFTGDPAANPSLSAAEQERVERMKQTAMDGMGYLQIQTTRPQTLAYALTDSPVGQLAWIAEKFKEWTDPAAALPEDAVDRDQLITNISLYWFTRSGASAARALYESMHAQEWGEAGPAPTGWAVFGADPIVRRLLDPEPTITHWSEFARGGHFPAMEVPDLLTDDIRTFFRAFR